jgi:hypothetical protein
MRLALAFLLLALPSGVEAACKQIKAESDIIGIRIGDAPSAVRVIGEAGVPTAEQDKNKAGADTSHPYVRFATRDGREELKLYEHYGDEGSVRRNACRSQTFRLSVASSSASPNRPSHAFSVHASNAGAVISERR